MPDSDKYMPNKLTFQVSTESNPHLLDIRGVLAAELSAEFGVKDWAISENTVQAYTKSKDQVVLVGFNRYGMQKNDVTNITFLEHVARLIGVLRRHDQLSGDRGVRRLGVRGQFFTPYRGSFEQLMSKVQSRLITISPQAVDCFGGLSLDDIGAPLYLSSDTATVHFSCGPGKREEVKNRQLPQHDENSLPLVGLLMDIDYFFAPDDQVTLSLTTIEERIREHVNACWSIHDRVRKLVVA